MTNAFHQPAQTRIGFQTSIDLVQKQTYSTTNNAGSKRSYEAVQQDTVPNDGESEPVRLTYRDPPPPLPGPRLKASSISLACAAPAQEVHTELSDYTQRKFAASTPGPDQNPLLSLAHAKYGLPDRLVSNLVSAGVQSIYPWQSSCLLGKGVLAGEQNLVYTAPTGGGKSLVADVLLIKKVIEQPTKKAILVLPYVALVQEKLKWLRRVVEGVSKHIDAEDQHSATASSWKWKTSQSCIRLAGFFGGSRTKATWVDIDIAVCTIEKANSLVNTALEDGKIDQLGIVVLDEMHMLDDENRGYLIELMITKLLCLQEGVQLVGMSATLSNPQLIADWLGAKFYVSKYRPVPVQEHLVYENSIYPTSNAKQFFQTASQLSSVSATQKPPIAARTIEKSLHRELDNSLSNAVVALAVETATTGYGVLVFCSSRYGTQATAVLISEAMPTEHVPANVLDKRSDLIASLQALPGGFETAFSKTIIYGVAFHHAGLTIEEREMVAEAFDRGILKVMVATCSLAAGINLPARRVVLNGARMGRDLVGPAMLRQMRGRAGRKGKDEIGETYLCCHKSDLETVADLLEAELPPVESCLTPEKRGVKRALLEVICTRLANSREAINEYIRCSLLYKNMAHAQVSAMVDAAMDNLFETRLIETTCFGGLGPTKLGQAIVASSLTPEDGIFIHNEMQRALESFVMDGEMHILYLFTPIQAAGEISWPVFRNEMERLDDSGMRAFRCVGVHPGFVNRLVNSGAELKQSTPEEIDIARTYRRAYCAFQLRDLCNEVPIHDISLKYAVPRGAVQNLAQTCHGFAAGMIKFCQRMGWGMLAAVLDHMVDRLHAGARSDLLEMAQVTYVKSRMARVLWENGLKSVRALAEAEAIDLVPIMMQAQQSRKLKLQGEAAEKLKLKLLEKAEIIVSSANRLWEKQQLLELEE